MSSDETPVVVTTGATASTFSVYHRDLPEIRSEGESPTDAATRLADAGLERAPVEEAIERIVRALIAVGDGYAVLIREQVKVDRAEAGRLLGAPMQAVLARGIESGLLRQDLPAEVMLELFGGALQAAVRLTERHQLGLEEASAATAALFLDGARAR